MNSGLIGKIEKAKRYAQERGRRIHLSGLQAEVDGDNDSHSVMLDGDSLRCTCEFYAGWGACAHTMALERVLEGMLPRSALVAQPA